MSTPKADRRSRNIVLGFLFSLLLLGFYDLRLVI